MARYKHIDTSPRFLAVGFGGGDEALEEGLRLRREAHHLEAVARLDLALEVDGFAAGQGVERIFPVQSPLVTKVEIKARGYVRRSRLYYLRDLRGKAARLKEQRF